jgi:hypothetical protein
MNTNGVLPFFENWTSPAKFKIIYIVSEDKIIMKDVAGW